MAAWDIRGYPHPIIVDSVDDGTTESHSDAMSRLLDLYRLPEEDLFRSRSEPIEEACYRQQERVAFVEKPLPQDTGQVAR